VASSPTTPARTWAPWLLAAPAIALLVAFFLVPFVLLIRVSFFESASGTGFYRPGTWTVQSYADLLGARLGRGIIAFTVALGVGVAVLAVLLGYPLALFIHSLPRRAKLLALGVVLLPKLANV
jgi:ABC-type spermidine/putrescine transport system permease subunit I